MRFAIVVFPGTWSDRDCFDVVNDVFQEDADYVWHKETDLSKYDCIILPGGFSYGDYLRPGAIARFSPIMDSVAKAAEDGKLVYGICNGFQILCEAGLLPGVLMRNDHLQFRCQWVNLRVERSDTAFTNACSAGQVLRVPISHAEGN
ncbi:MAG: phosphoribosylformylglycinamidine synthase subunit PurQ, partial [Chloroflexi bacterium]|nr:phosphoribosylformylglycinamidine synthase subunit PurQ [Chloroflexota bacterium]